MIKESPEPIYGASDANAVDVVRWCGGNQAADIIGPDAIAIGPPMLLKATPVWVNQVWICRLSSGIAWHTAPMTLTTPKRSVDALTPEGRG